MLSGMSNNLSRELSGFSEFSEDFLVPLEKNELSREGAQLALGKLALWKIQLEAYLESLPPEENVSKVDVYSTMPTEEAVAHAKDSRDRVADFVTRFVGETKKLLVDNLGMPYLEDEVGFFTTSLSQGNIPGALKESFSLLYPQGLTIEEIKSIPQRIAGVNNSPYHALISPKTPDGKQYPSIQGNQIVLFHPASKHQHWNIDEDKVLSRKYTKSYDVPSGLTGSVIDLGEEIVDAHVHIFSKDTYALAEQAKCKITEHAIGMRVSTKSGEWSIIPLYSTVSDPRMINEHMKGIRLFISSPSGEMRIVPIDLFVTVDEFVENEVVKYYQVGKEN